MSFQQMVPVSKMDYERWQRVKARYRDYNPNYAEMMNLEDQIADLAKEKGLTDNEKFRIEGVLRERINNIRRTLPASVPMALPKSKETGDPSLGPGGFEVPPAIGVASLAIAQPNAGAAAGVPPALAGDPTAQGAVQDDDDEDDLPSKIVDTSNYDNVHAYFGNVKEMQIDSKYRDVYKEVLQLLAKNPDKIGVNTRRELILQGKVIPKSNAHDLISSLFHTRKAQNTIGAKKFIAALKDVGATDRHMVTKPSKIYFSNAGGYPVKSPKTPKTPKRAKAVDVDKSGDLDEKADDFKTPQRRSILETHLPPLRPALRTEQRLVREPILEGKGLKRVRISKKTTMPPGKRRPTASSSASSSTSSSLAVKHSSTKKLGSSSKPILRLYR
jgi:hypothetical protein